MPVTNVPMSVVRNGKTLGLQHLQLPDVAASSGPPDRTRIIYHGTDELFVKRHTGSGGQAASPVKEVVKHAQSLSCFLSYLVDVCRPG
jgi:hypothetical protein